MEGGQARKDRGGTVREMEVGQSQGRLRQDKVREEYGRTKSEKKEGGRVTYLVV